MKILGFITNLSLVTATFLQSTALLAHDNRLQDNRIQTVEDVSPVFASTDNIILKSSDPVTGATYSVEVFETGNDEQTRALVAELKEQLRQAVKADPNGIYEVHVRMGNPEQQDALTTKYDEEAHFFGQQIAAVAPKQIKLSAENRNVDPSLRAQWKRLRQQNYRMGFAVVRGITSGGVSFVSLLTTPQIPKLAMAAVGLVNGAMSAAIQFWSKPFYNWATDAGWLANVFKIPPAKKLEAGESAPVTLRSVVNYVDESSRWVASEIAYVVITQVSMVALGLATQFDSWHIMSSALFSYAAQGTWDHAITYLRKQAEAHKILTQNKIDFRANSAYLVVAGFSMGLLMANLKYVANVEYGYYAMIASGVAAYTVARVRGRKAPSAPSVNRRVPCEVILKKMDGHVVADLGHAA